MSCHSVFGSLSARSGASAPRAPCPRGLNDHNDRPTSQYSGHQSSSRLGRRAHDRRRPARWQSGRYGIGFNGGQLLGLAIGGCFCNDLQYVAHDMGILLASVQVSVSVTFEGTPMLVKEARMQVAATPLTRMRI
ncbi:MAG TPA: OsmC family protein [Pseudolabrys sp.]|nr:OsmC family protein [Pseudolabrys sp.]